MILESCLAISIFTTDDKKTLVEILNILTKDKKVIIYDSDLEAYSDIKNLEKIVIEMNKGCKI